MSLARSGCSILEMALSMGQRSGIYKTCNGNIVFWLVHGRLTFKSWMRWGDLISVLPFSLTFSCQNVSTLLSRRWSRVSLVCNWLAIPWLCHCCSGEGDERKRPVIIHRAILGSVERMIAILTENYGGKWYACCTVTSQIHACMCSFHRPFWLSPCQVMVVPVAPKYDDYAEQVCCCTLPDHHNVQYVETWTPMLLAVR